MITPEYRISQDEHFLVLNIRLPYVKISQCEMLVEPKRYSFHLKPYFLKLEFEQEFVEGDEGLESTIYDSSTYNLEVKIKKKVPGEHFKNLDVISALLQAKKPKLQGAPKIEVLGSTSTGEEGGEDELAMQEQESVLASPYRFGFNLNHLDMFKNHQEELFELADLDPLSTKLEERASALRLVEDEKFNADHYICNLFDMSAITPLLQAELVLPVRQKNVPFQTLKSEYGDKTLKDLVDEPTLAAILKVGNREHLLSPKTRQQAKLMLVQLWFAYLYDWRTMDFELSCESAWTINKLSAFLAGFVHFELQHTAHTPNPTSKLFLSSQKNISCHALSEALRQE